MNPRHCEEATQVGLARLAHYRLPIWGKAEIGGRRSNLRHACASGGRLLRFARNDVYPVFAHALSASSTRRAAAAMATSIILPSTVVLARPFATAASKASSTRA